MATVYVGHLFGSISKRDLEKTFKKYGQVNNVWIHKSRQFGFVDMDTTKEAKNSVLALNQQILKGRRIKVELSKSSRGRFENSNGADEGGDNRESVLNESVTDKTHHTDGSQNYQRRRTVTVQEEYRNSENQVTVSKRSTLKSTLKRGLVSQEKPSSSNKKLKVVESDLNNSSANVFSDTDVEGLNPNTHLSCPARESTADNTETSPPPELSYDVHKYVGATTFGEVKEDENFVDKTLFIEQIILDNNKVVLITAPARFGKSINIRTAELFFSALIDENGTVLPPMKIEDSVFAGTKIAKKKLLVEKHFQKYVVIRLSFDGTAETYQDAFDCFREEIITAYEKHMYLRSGLDDVNRQRFDHFRNTTKTITVTTLGHSLDKLFQLLDAFHNKEKENDVKGDVNAKDEKNAPRQQFILLVDEFDAIVTSAMFSVSEKDLARISNLRDTILGKAAKIEGRGRFLRFSVFTGVTDACCPVSSPLRNIARFAFLHPTNKFGDFYGISEPELKEVLSRRNTATIDYDTVCEFYNGYKWNGINFLNTWSVMRALNTNSCGAYFAEASSLILQFMPLLRCDVFFTMITDLIKGEDVPVPHTNFHEVMNVQMLSKLALSCKDKTSIVDAELVMTILYQNGWITFGRKPNTIRVPNKEIRTAMALKFYAPFFNNKYGVNVVKLQNCGNLFSHVLTSEFDLREFCKEFHLLVFVTKNNTRIQLNRVLLRSFMLIISYRTNLPLESLALECPVESYQTSNRCDYAFYCNSCLIIVEIKVDDTGEEAINQIKNRRYLDIKNNKIIVEKKNQLKRIILLGIAIQLVDHKTSVIRQILGPNDEEIETKEAKYDLLY